MKTAIVVRTTSQLDDDIKIIIIVCFWREFTRSFLLVDSADSAIISSIDCVTIKTNGK